MKQYNMCCKVNQNEMKLDTPRYSHIFIENKGLRFLVRDDTSDKFVVQEVIGDTYRKLNLRPSDVVLDLGMNIGIFSCLALSKGVKKVVGYEAEHDNYNLAKQNIKNNQFIAGKSEIYNLAVIGNNDVIRCLSINKKKNKGAHSLISIKGRYHVKVKCININRVIARIKPTIIKMDVEGAEYEILKAIKSFKGIREIIFEFHHANLNDTKTHDKYFEIITLMKKHFKTVEASKINQRFLVSLIYCNNQRKVNNIEKIQF